jgi:formate dehydrogenase subunit delta
MDIHHLVKMANQVGDFFAPYPDHDEVIKSIAVHLKNSWDPRMRRQIADYVNQSGGADLKESVRAAILSLTAPSAPIAAKEAAATDEAPGDD